MRAGALVAFHGLVLRPVLRLYFGVRYRHRRRLPRGPCLVVANHNSHLDALVLMSLFPLRRLPHVHPVAASDYWGVHPIRRFAALFLMNGVSIDRTVTGSADPLAPLVRALREGETLILFPEGSRGEAGVVGPFRAGIGKIAQQVPGLLVVPVFLSGPERSMPRGTVLPMPLGLEVHVGKPRTYSPELDAKRIAEEVRRDVLALAPPSPAEPGPRPRPPVRIAVCSLDGQARREAWLEIVARVGRLDRTIGVGEPVLEAEGGSVREFTGRLPLVRSRWWAALLAWVFRSRGLYRGTRFAETVERARMDEAFSEAGLARLLVEDGDPLVDLLAWAQADFDRGVFDERGLDRVRLFLSGERKIPSSLWWTFLRKAPAVWLLNVFDLARPTPPDLLVLLRVPVARAMEKIRAAGEPIEPYQNEAFLERLGLAYEQVAALLARRGRTEVVAFQVGADEPERIGEEVATACARKIVELARRGTSP